MNIPREPTHCWICAAELTGGLDTYGEPGYELCRDCFLNPPHDMRDDYGSGLRMCVNEHGQLVTFLVDDGDDVEDYWGEVE